VQECVSGLLNVITDLSLIVDSRWDVRAEICHGPIRIDEPVLGVLDISPADDLVIIIDGFSEAQVGRLVERIKFVHDTITIDEPMLMVPIGAVIL
jgi:hypothetical protein